MHIKGGTKRNAVQNGHKVCFLLILVGVIWFLIVDFNTGDLCDSVLLKN